MSYCGSSRITSYSQKHHIKRLSEAELVVKFDCDYLKLTKSTKTLRLLNASGTKLVAEVVIPSE